MKQLQQNVENVKAITKTIFDISSPLNSLINLSIFSYFFTNATKSIGSLFSGVLTILGKYLEQYSSYRLS